MAYLKYPLTFLFLNPARHVIEVEKTLIRAFGE